MRRQLVPLVGVLLLSPLLTSPAKAGGRVNCGPPSTRTQRLSPLARGMGEASEMVASWQQRGDITYSVGKDGRGRLWIIESMQKDRDPYIYEIVEPDPYKATSVRLHMRHHRAGHPLAHLSR